MTKIKAVHIITKLELGGAQENTLYTVGHLNRSRFEPVLVSGTEGILVEEAKALKGVRAFFLPELVREISPYRDLRCLLKLAQLLKALGKEGGTRKPMIVHTHSSKAGILGRWAAAMAGVRVIVHSIHGYGFNCFQPALSRGTLVAAERITSPITTHFVAVSRANLEQGLQLKLFERDRVTLIRSGIELTHFENQSEPKEKKKRALGFDPRIPLVGMVACLKPQKAPLDFVLMASEVLRALPEVNFALIGDGELRQQIASLIESLHLTQRVFLLGWRRDMPAVMRALDILVLTSLWEGLPRVFPQAMATGLPIVATRVDGAPEAVRDGVNGFLLPPHNPKAMAEKVVELIRFPERAKEMGERGKESVREFDIRLMMEQQEGLYETLLARAQADSLA